MLPCSSSEASPGPVFLAKLFWQLVTILFVACTVLPLPAASAPYDQQTSPSQPRPVQLHWLSGSDAYPVRQVAFQAESPVNPGASPVAQDFQHGPAFQNGSNWEENSPAGMYAPPAMPEGNCAGCAVGGSCCDQGGNCCDAPRRCESPCTERLWVRGEYLLWWMPGANIPPLATTSPVGTPRDEAGRLDQPNTSVIFGNSSLDNAASSGARITLGCWLSPCQGWGIEGVYLTTGRHESQFQADGSSYPILARPFYNIESGSQGQDADLVVYPQVAEGSLAIATTSEFQAAELLLRKELVRQCGLQVDVVLGYRYGQLQESLSVSESTTSIDRQGPAPFGTTFQLFDQFAVQNTFNGGEAGAVLHQRCRRWLIDYTMKLAVGGTRSRVTIDGSTTTTTPGSRPVTYAGGLLAQPTNIGQYEQDAFSFMPELGITIGYDLTRQLRAMCGYTIIYWSKVARPGDQIDPELNPSQFPPGTLVGAPHPQFAFRTTDFWAQGLTLGLEYRF